MTGNSAQSSGAKVIDINQQFAFKRGKAGHNASIPSAHSPIPYIKGNASVFTRTNDIPVQKPTLTEATKNAFTVPKQLAPSIQLNKVLSRGDSEASKIIPLLVPFIAQSSFTEDAEDFTPTVKGAPILTRGSSIASQKQGATLS